MMYWRDKVTLSETSCDRTKKGLMLIEVDLLIGFYRKKIRIRITKSFNIPVMIYCFLDVRLNLKPLDDRTNHERLGELEGVAILFL